MKSIRIWLELQAVHWTVIGAHDAWRGCGRFALSFSIQTCSEGRKVLLMSLPFQRASESINSPSARPASASSWSDFQMFRLNQCRCDHGLWDRFTKQHWLTTGNQLESIASVVRKCHICHSWSAVAPCIKWMNQGIICFLPESPRELIQE